jgi:hypothetical protein
MECFNSYIFNDEGMRENDILDIVNRVTNVFQNRKYQIKVEGSDKRWLDDNLEVIFGKILQVLKGMM